MKANSKREAIEKAKDQDHPDVSDVGHDYDESTCPTLSKWRATEIK